LRLTCRAADGPAPSSLSHLRHPAERGSTYVAKVSQTPSASSRCRVARDCLLRSCSISISTKSCKPMGDPIRGCTGSPRGSSLSAATGLSIAPCCRPKGGGGHRGPAVQSRLHGPTVDLRLGWWRSCLDQKSRPSCDSRQAAKREAADCARPVDQTRRGQTRCAYQAARTQSASSPLKTGARLCSTLCSGSTWSEWKRSSSVAMAICASARRVALPGNNACYRQWLDA